MLQRDLDWIERTARLPHARGIALEALHGWLDWLAQVLDATLDRRIKEQLRTAQVKVQRALGELRIEN